MVINKLKLTGKYLDQPLLVSKFKKAVPKVFVGGAILYGAGNVYKAPEHKKNSAIINNAAVLTATVGSALAAPKLASKIIGKTYEKYAKKDIIERNTKLVDAFISEENQSDSITKILNKAKEHVLNFKEIKTIHKELPKTDKGKQFLNDLIPEPQNITSKDIKNEIGRLSIIGAIPVVGGVAGGIAGEKISEGKLSKENTANRIKEGAYQYLANIFLCNVGAGIALEGMEKANIKSKSARALGMVGGIVTTGIIGGSAIANYIGKKVINPLFDGKEKTKGINKKLNSEREPEVIDVCLHTDDIATVAVMSGLKWIEPALPILYGISGYRAGIGYRNGKNSSKCDINS